MLRIVGDVCFSDGYFDAGFGIGSKLKSNYNPFINIDFGSDDIWFGNLECVVSNISNLKGFGAECFRVPSEYVSSLHHMNIYCVANNHIMQHGNEAYDEMLTNINKLGSKYVGNLSDKTIIVEYKQCKFGIMTFSQRQESFSQKPLYWLRPEYNEIESELEKLRNCDFKIVYLHWGYEFVDYPNVDQKLCAHWLVDIGFDLVVGTHPHVLQGFEVYKEKYIFYSLGNFLFNMPTEETRYSAIVNIEVEKGKMQVSFDYVFNDKEKEPKIIEQGKVPDSYLFETLNKKLSLEEDNEVYFKNMLHQLFIYRVKNYWWIIKTLHRHDFSELIFIIKDFVSRRLKKLS